MREIKLLSDSTVNRIAAGEVIERPASVVKELIENSIDAGADCVEVEIERGGKNLIRISDNGDGIVKDQLELAVQRHATSKLNEEDINNITFFGFRGEALPSIASVSKMQIESKVEGQDAWQLVINGGKKEGLLPTSRKIGTIIQVRDIFAFTPVRLKFLKSDKAEQIVIHDIVNKFALAFEEVEFKFICDGKVIAHIKKLEHYQNQFARISDIINKDFADNCSKVEADDDGIKIKGFVGLPTYNRNTGMQQYFYVNNRIIKDKILLHAVKTAYADLIPHGRFAAVVLFITLNNYDVDVNVHPTKAEIRFKDAQKIRQIVIRTIREGLAATQHKSASTIANTAVNKAIEERSTAFAYQSVKSAIGDREFKQYQPISPTNRQINAGITAQSKPQQSSFEMQDSAKQKEFSAMPKVSPSPTRIESTNDNVSSCGNEELPLGTAQFQINNTYIVSRVADGFILVDQHAAHERLVLEEMKAELATGKVLKVQHLLIPEVVELGQVLSAKLLEYRKDLGSLGFAIEPNGVSQILVREIPALLDKVSIPELLKDLANDLLELDTSTIVLEKKNEILANIACHWSIRAGRKLTLEEMNSILRKIEQTPFAAQCNHGRPTHIKFSAIELEKMFERY